ncbi:ABC transporter permease [Zobellella maritima]|uniref:ABC transporter permease n=1 Tax=Zobellella maritima TaxID=2059725 RepID=UPI000E303D39|nr:ABC transporter permease [Zobellella maritima]
MQSFSISPREMAASLWRNRSLIKALTKREVIGRYRGSFLGILWSFFNPLLMLAVYTFVFSVVFQARWDGGSESKTEFALVLFSGIMMFSLFSECINRAPSLILANTSYVKKVLFPLDILPWVSLGTALFHFLVSLIVWLVAYFILFGIPQPTVLLLPLLLVPLTLLVMGLSWILASLAVYLRDISQFIGIATTMLMFLSPIFYPAEALPEAYRKFIYLNPLTIVIEQARDLLFWGRYPDWSILSAYTVVAALMAWLGFVWFQKTRKGFADVL